MKLNFYQLNNNKFKIIQNKIYSIHLQKEMYQMINGKIILKKNKKKNNKMIYYK